MNNLFWKRKNFLDWILFVFIYIVVTFFSEFIPGTFLFICVSLFILFLLCVIIKLLIILYYMTDRNENLDNKNYKYLPRSWKDIITIYRNEDSNSKNILININVFIVIVNLFLVILLFIVLNLIYFILL